MNDVRSKILENYRVTYDPIARLFELRRAWSEVEGSVSDVLFVITEKALIATLLDLSKEEVQN